MPVKFFLMAVSSFLTAIICIFLFRKLSLRYKILIVEGVPFIGGIAISLSFIFVSLVGFLFYGNLSQAALAIIVTSFIMLLFGLIDDWRELSILAKFSVEVIATALLIFFGVRTYIVYIGGPLNIIITFIWVIGITNAFNHLDIMDGLAAGTAVIISFAFFVISLSNGEIQTGILSLVLAAAGLGFLFYNWPPATIYMGNTGSHFLGFVLAAIAMLISYAPMERKVALFSPVLILGLPIFDTAFVIAIRVFKKVSPFKKSNDHLALRFLALGYSKKKALFFMLSFCLFFCLCGITVSRVSNPWGIGVIISAVLATLIVAFKMNKVTAHG